MPIVNNAYIPEADITEQLADGRKILIAPAGKPIVLEQAYKLGILKRPGPVIPYETKEEPDPTRTPFAGPEVLGSDPIDATAAAIALADEYNVDLKSITGTGKGGRITKYDIEAAVQKAQELRNS